MREDPLTKGEFEDWANNHHETLKVQVKEMADKIDDVQKCQAKILEKIGNIKGINKVMVPLVITLIAAFITAVAAIITLLWM